MRVTLLLLAAASTSPAMALEFSRDASDKIAIIGVTGTFEPGDGERFVRFATDDKAIVVLASPGGELTSAITIGEHIRMKGYSTVVPPNATCASACGLVWLAGVVRSGTVTSKIGFHAAYTGKGDVTSSGNAVVGAYLNKIGVSYKAIRYITSPEPADMTWLTFEKARDLGIDIFALDMPKSSEPIGLGGAPTPQSAPPATPPRSATIGDFRLACVPLVREGRDPVTVINVTRENNLWRVVHIAASGAQYDRGTQYRMTADVGFPVWYGQHLRKADTQIRGEISRINGKFYYNEKVTGKGELMADMTSKCDSN